MIFVEALIAALIVYWALSRHAIRDYRIIIYVMSGFFIFSLIPSLTVPYVLDDLDYLHDLAGAIDSHHVFQWLVAPANEHVTPLLKYFYLFCYKHFWLNPEFFHVFILALCLGNIVLIYRLIFVLTQSSISAFIGASIMASTNLTDEAIIIGANSLIFFCTLLFLLLFYAIYRYAGTQKSYWRYVAFFAILLAPSFALGLTSIFFVVIFYRLCLSQEFQQKGKNLFPLLLIGWLLSLIPYVYSMNAILHAKHYHDIGVKSTFGAASFSPVIPILGEYVTWKLIPSLMANLYLSFGLFFLCFFTAIKFFKEIDWKRILFFVSFGLINNFIIYVFRSKWGISAVLEASRYDAFPVIMMATSYALVLDVFLKQIPQINKTAAMTLIYVICFFAVINGSLCRYSNGNGVFKKTEIMQNFNVVFRKVFVDYFREYDPAQLRLKNAEIAVPFSRDHWRSTDFYARYILPSSIYHKIVWSQKTDPEFLKYLEFYKLSILTGGQ